MAQAKVLSVAEYENIERINALFAEHVMGWLAVGQRDVYQSSGNSYKKTWQGAPSRTANLENVPRYWQSLEAAWQGFSILPADAYILFQRIEGAWYCEVYFDNAGTTLARSRSKGETESAAIVRCLLKLSGHPLPELE